MFKIGMFIRFFQNIVMAVFQLMFIKEGKMATVTKGKQIIDLSKPIMVSMESFALMKKLKKVGSNGDMIEIALIECDQVSRNRTYYGFEDIQLGMKERRFAERLAQKTLFGEASHPSQAGLTDDSSYLQRLTQVEPSRIVWRIDRVWNEGKTVMGVIQWAGPFGSMYKDLVMNHGSNIAASIRAYTPNYIKKNDANGEYVQKVYPLFITTWDLVDLPGLGGCRIVNPSVYAESTKDDLDKGPVSSSSTERWDEVKTPTSKTVVFKDPISEIRSMIKSGNENANIIQDLFGIELNDAKMILSGKNTLSTFSNDGRRLDIPLSSAVLADIL